jgi:hypothetical protein
MFETVHDIEELQGDISELIEQLETFSKYLESHAIKLASEKSN